MPIAVVRRTRANLCNRACSPASKSGADIGVCRADALTNEARAVRMMDENRS